MRLPPCRHSEGCEPAVVFTQAAVEHSVRALVAAADSFSPFEHLYVRDVFHRDVYACMMHLLPPAEAYTRSHHLSNLHEVRVGCLVGVSCCAGVKLRIATKPV